MSLEEFKKYVQAYCAEHGIISPSLYRNMWKRFSKTYSTGDMECNVWEFCDNEFLNVREKQLDKYKIAPPMPKCAPPISNSFSTILGMTASVMVVDECTQAAPCKLNWAKNNNKEDTMTCTTYNEIEATRKYLASRLQDARYVVREALSKQFNLNKPNRPVDYKTLIDAIKNGQYTLDEKRTSQIDGFVADDDWYGDALDGIKWTLPNMPDRDGYKLADEAASKAYTAAKDIIFTGDAAAGLKALQDFEGFTYTPPSA